MDCPIKTPRLILTKCKVGKCDAVTQTHMHTHTLTLPQRREQASWKPIYSDFCNSPLYLPWWLFIKSIHQYPVNNLCKCKVGWRARSAENKKRCFEDDNTRLVPRF